MIAGIETEKLKIGHVTLTMHLLGRVVIDIFQKYRRYSISMPALKVSSIPISIRCRKSIDIEIDTSISILL